MPTTSFFFVHPSHIVPYVKELFEYTNDGKEGIILFDGYYHVKVKEENDDFYYGHYLPQKVIMNVYVTEDEPYLVENNHYHYAYIENKMFFVEFYKRDIIECTNKISEIEDEDGSTMRVCFFPTNKQRLYFRVLEEYRQENETVNEFLDRLKIVDDESGV